ncbi:MAG: rod shape-determining protein MreD [Cytophagales bacterium]|nr:rod shape-determining protein MreD [Cytophagales bacterium]
MSGIMPKGSRQLLLPANPSFIWLSIFASFVVNLLLNFLLGGWASWLPDFLAITLVFWSLHQPQRIGMGVAFIFGLAMDVHQTTLLGEHALCYTLLSFVVTLMQRRVLWFKPAMQALQLLPLFAAAHLLEIVLRGMLSSAWPQWQVMLAAPIEALCWPFVSAVLLMPQRRAPDPDVHRPL